MINLKLILLYTSHALDRRAVQYFTESLTVCTLLYSCLILSPLVSLLGRQNLKSLSVSWILMHIKAFNVLSARLIA